MAGESAFDVIGLLQSELPYRSYDWNGPSEFFFTHIALSQAVKGVLAGIGLATGFIAVTGEAGTGKTLLVKRVIEGIPSTVAPLLLRDPRVSFEEFVEFACKQFNLEQLVVKVETPFEDRVEVLQRYLVGQQRQGRAVVVLIDDAEVMTEALLSNLLLFSTSHLRGEKLLQIVLVGLPNLEQLLSSPVFHDLSKDRVMLTLTPLPDTEVGAFIRHRLAGFNAEDKEIFSTEAIAEIARHSRGVPRLINTICGLAMKEAQLERRQKVTGEIIGKVAKTLLQASKSTEGPPRGGGKESTRSVGSETVATAQPDPKRVPNVRAQPPETKAPVIRLVDPGKRQEYTLSRLDKLNKILRNLQSESPGVEASALISEDGLMLASSLPQDLEETRVAGMTATLLNLGTRAAGELRRGEVQEVIVRGERGYAVMISAGRGVLLLVLANETAKLGLIFFDMREAIKGIKNIL
ncbi:MAG: roadblock/LC7 domain-containing protein [Proteobacteria bacterium]|nr:roadblock/LC7 domain-containing protein [Pseudomonadota bacterium]